MNIDTTGVITLSSGKLNTIPKKNLIGIKYENKAYNGINVLAILLLLVVKYKEKNVRINIFSTCLHVNLAYFLSHIRNTF